MKAIKRLQVLFIILFIMLFFGTNLLLNGIEEKQTKAYRVDVKRAEKEIINKGLDGVEISQYPYLITIKKDKNLNFLKTMEEEPYILRVIEDEYYRFYYKNHPLNERKICLLFNGLLLIMFIFFWFFLLYMKNQIIKPFEKMNTLSFSLAKGNLTKPVQQEKNKYLGNFLWGVDMLREKLEEQKLDGLRLQKEKKMLILSLAHDIKTPLLAIRLYAQALSKNLYKDAEKQKEVATHIEEKVDEMESYIGSIMEATREDFLNLDVKVTGFYLEEVSKEILSYYKDKLELLKIPFDIDFGENHLIKGDQERVIEVFQNLMENAIKYGDGSRISIHTKEEGDSIIIVISNGGVTLREEELPHIFDSFYRGINGQHIKGNGLGLYICRELLKEMDGEIYARLKEQTMEMFVVLRKS